MDTILKTAPAALPSGWRAPFGRMVSRAVLGIFNLLLVWQRRVEDRETLRHMTEAQLKDIGLARGAIEAESAKPFWRA
jgi:uncharacterized protein YjiS (DUF1127 family)